jgi:hypothetical protein
MRYSDASREVERATWLEQARKEAVPHVRFGKYVRFRFSEVNAAGLQAKR